MSRYRSVNHKYRTDSLFWETRNPDYEPVYTLKDRPHEGCPSLKQLYLEIADPTEYEFAQRALGSWEHWKVLQGSPSLRNDIEDWREELRAKIESERYYEVVGAATEAKGDQTRLSAAKYLAERYGIKPETKRGRPSNEEVANERRRRAGLDADVADDAKRLGLVKTGS